MSSFLGNHSLLVGGHLEKHHKMKNKVRDQDTPHHLGLEDLGRNPGRRPPGWGRGWAWEVRSSLGFRGSALEIRGYCPAASLTQNTEL